MKYVVEQKIAPRPPSASWGPCRPEDVVPELNGLHVYLDRGAQDSHGKITSAIRDPLTGDVWCYARLESPAGARVSANYLLDELEPCSCRDELPPADLPHDRHELVPA